MWPGGFRAADNSRRLCMVKDLEFSRPKYGALPSVDWKLMICFAKILNKSASFAKI